jgi:ATP phosphoribosyltransferase
MAKSIHSLLRLAIPDGSMQAVTLALLHRAGITIPAPSSRQKRAVLGEGFIESVAFMRPMQIPICLDRGYFDLAIVGEDALKNCNADAIVLFKMAVARKTKQAVRIVLAASKEKDWRSLDDLPRGATIATEYVELVERYLVMRGRSDIGVMRAYGGTEQMIAYGAQAIVDVVETGSSLTANNLEIIEVIMTSDTVIAANRQAYEDPAIREVIDWFVAVVKGAWDAGRFVRLEANVPADKLKAVVAIAGGMKAPTVSQIYGREWASLVACIPKEKQQEVVFSLLQLGVKDICIQAVDIIMGVE